MWQPAEPNHLPQSRPLAGQFWASATSFGAAWGLLEFTLGSFLHNLRLPMSGQIMALIGIVILLAQRQLSPWRGLSLATGLVAMGCKALSPGGIILGPMLGIPAEALLVELGLLLAPRAWSSALLAGGLAALWPVSQKILTQFIYFGGDLLDLAKALALQAQKSLGLAAQDGWTLAWLSVSALASLGGIAALVGRHLGQSLARQGLETKRDQAAKQLGAPARDPASGAGHSAGHSAPWGANLGGDGSAARLGTAGASAAPPTATRWRLARVFLARRDRILGALAVLSLASWMWLGAGLFAGSVAALVAGLVLLRPRAARRLWMPRFWLWSSALVLASGLLLGPKDLAWSAHQAPFLSSLGLLAGALMLLRGLYIFALSSWLRQAVSAAQLQAALGRLAGEQSTGSATRRGLAALGWAMLGAPRLMQELGGLLPSNSPGQRSARRTHIRAKLGWLKLLLEQAWRAAEGQDTQTQAPGARVLRARPKIVGLIGARAQGKTRAIFQLHAWLDAQGLSGGGLSQPASQGRQIYELVDLTSGERRPFARRRQAEDREHQEIPRGPASAPLPNTELHEITINNNSDPTFKEPPIRRMGYLFDTQAWPWAEAQLRQAWQRCQGLSDSQKVVFVDELGRLEARGEGHMQTLRSLLETTPAERSPKLVIAAIQAAVAPEVEAQLGGLDLRLELPADLSQLAEFTQQALNLAELPPLTETSAASATPAHKPSHIA